MDAQAAGGSAPLAAVPPMPASFDQFGSMAASLSVEDVPTLRESNLPEESGTNVDGDQASAEGGGSIILSNCLIVANPRVDSFCFS
ncbi:unnamed protein product [Cochlearia groenlandica]